MKLEVDKLTTRIGGRDLVRDVSFSLDNEFLAVLGRSSSGKTVLLRTILGLLDLSSGRIRLGGRDISSLAPYKRNISMVFQDGGLYPHMRAYDNIIFPKTRKRANKARVLRLAKALGLEDSLGKYPLDLSGGQKTRLALARALNDKKDLFILDDPFTGLDYKSRLRSRRLVKDLYKELNIPFIMVSQDIQDVTRLADKVLVLEDGRPSQYGPLDEVLLRPKTLDVMSLVTRGRVNQVPGRIEAGQLVLASLDKKIPLGLIENNFYQDGEEVTLAFSQEDLRVGGGRGPGIRLMGKIYDYKFYGSKIDLAFKLGGNYLWAQVDSREDISKRDELDLLIPYDRTFLY